MFEAHSCFLNAQQMQENALSSINYDMKKSELSTIFQYAES